MLFYLTNKCFNINFNAAVLSISSFPTVKKCGSVHMVQSKPLCAELGDKNGNQKKIDLGKQAEACSCAAGKHKVPKVINELSGLKYVGGMALCYYGWRLSSEGEREVNL